VLNVSYITSFECNEHVFLINLI